MRLHKFLEQTEYLFRVAINNIAEECIWADGWERESSIWEDVLVLVYMMESEKRRRKGLAGRYKRRGGSQEKSEDLETENIDSYR